MGTPTASMQYTDRTRHKRQRVPNGPTVDILPWPLVFVMPSMLALAMLLILKGTTCAMPSTCRMGEPTGGRDIPTDQTSTGALDPFIKLRARFAIRSLRSEESEVY